MDCSDKLGQPIPGVNVNVQDVEFRQILTESSNANVKKGIMSFFSLLVTRIRLLTTTDKLLTAL
jgi:hypothetical protein